MRLLTELDPLRKNLEPWVEDMAYKMGESAFSLTLFTDNFAKGIDSLLQFAVAVMLDKPILLLVPTGVVVPETVKRIAVAIEYCDMNDKAAMDTAVKRLITIAKEKAILPAGGGGTAK